MPNEIVSCFAWNPPASAEVSLAVPVNQIPPVNILEVNQEDEEVEDEKDWDVEKILERRQDTRGYFWYLVRWASKEESWTEEWNLGKGLKEEFEENIRRMNGDKRPGGEENEEGNRSRGGKGIRCNKRLKLVEETDDDRKVKCSAEGCNRRYKSKKSMRQHYRKHHELRKISESVKSDSSSKPKLPSIVSVFADSGVGSKENVGCSGSVADADGVEGTGDSSEDLEVTHVCVVDAPTPAIIQIDDDASDDYDSNDDLFSPVMVKRRKPPVDDDGNNKEPSQNIELLGENQDQKESNRLESSIPASSQHVEDDQKPSTSASMFRIKQEIKIEKTGEKLFVKPSKKTVLDLATLCAWAEAQEEKCSELKKTLEDQITFTNNANTELRKRTDQFWALDKHAKTIERKLKEEEGCRKESDEKFRKEEAKRKMAEEERRKLEERLKEAEEELLALKRRNEEMEEFAEHFISSQNAQRRLEEMATKFLKDGGHNEKLQ